MLAMCISCFVPIFVRSVQMFQRPSCLPFVWFCLGKVCLCVSEAPMLYISCLFKTFFMFLLCSHYALYHILASLTSCAWTLIFVYATWLALYLPWQYSVVYVLMTASTK